MTEKNGKIVVVAGATGHQGGAVARRLVANGFTVRGLTRTVLSPASMELSGLGVQMIKCELNDVPSTRRALEGAWGAFGVFAMGPEGSCQEEVQAINFALQAKNAGVQSYVYSSVASAHRGTGIPHFENKWRVENAVRGVNFPLYTILRPAFFMENFISPWIWPGIMQGTLSMAVKPSTRIQMVALADIGAYAHMAFEDNSPLNREAVELAGDELTMPQAAGIITETLGMQVRFEQLPIEQIRQVSTGMALMYEWFDRVGLNVDIEAVNSKYNFRPTTFRQWAARVKWPVPAHP